MKFRNTTIKALIAASVLAIFPSCSDIDGDDRYIELPPVIIENTPRYVLLEEFTGQFCINCPRGHEVIEALKKQYGDRLITVSFHSGPVGQEDKNSIAEDNPFGIVGLRNDESQGYYIGTGATPATGFPFGIVDRTSGILTDDQWGTVIREGMMQESPVDITLTPALTDGDAPEINVEVALEASKDVVGKLQLWVVESNIIAIQMQGDGSTKIDYVHNNVFRKAINSVDGAPISIVPGKVTTYSAATPVKDNWNPDNLTVVAVVYNQTGVIQAIECALGKTASNAGESADETTEQ